ncbi:Lrp/AsnC ligand binding domain-containing protein [Thermococcus sp. M39]|uniref:Lrp/AsnC ligand binding domain-containing protein n=1 Tax=unclassified Thermococcus TaxID=2627626 RepID=UPI003211F1FF
MVVAFILIVTKPGCRDEVYGKLKDNPVVREVYEVYGGYDVIVRIEVEDIKELDDFRNSVLRKIGKEVEMTETVIVRGGVNG